MKNKHKLPIGQLVPQLPYISPWKPIDSNREIEEQLAKHRLLEEIIPSHELIHTFRKTFQSLPQRTASSSIGKRFNPNNTCNAFGFQGKYKSKKSKRRFKTYHQREEPQPLGNLQSAIFATKHQPTVKLKVVSVGKELCSEDQQENYTNTVIASPNKAIIKPQAAQSASKTPSNPKKHSLNSKRIAYKTISNSLLSKLSQIKHLNQAQNSLLSQTLQQFIDLQKQI